VQRKTGRFEAAHGGTLFLDEIGIVPIEVQEKILRVVEYGSFEKVGSSEPVHVDTRIIGATNADLPAMTRAGLFKPDLLDRLSFEVLFLPPLRARGKDIMFLAGHFAARMAYQLGRGEMPEFSSQAVAQLERYLWPGNVRELKNVVERAVYRSEGNIINDIIFNPFQAPFDQTLALPAPALSSAAPDLPSVETGGDEESLDRPFAEAVRDLEVRLLKQAMKKARHNQSKAARLLGLTYHQFRGLYRKYHTEL